MYAPKIDGAINFEPTSFFVKYDFDNKKMKIELVPIEREKTSKSKHQIIHEIANVFTERILNDPDFWKFSHLKNNSAFVNSFSLELVRIGVVFTYGSILVFALRISDKSII